MPRPLLPLLLPRSLVAPPWPLLLPWPTPGLLPWPLPLPSLGLVPLSFSLPLVLTDPEVARVEEVVPVPDTVLVVRVEDPRVTPVLRLEVELEETLEPVLRLEVVVTLDPVEREEVLLVVLETVPPTDLEAVELLLPTLPLREELLLEREELLTPEERPEPPELERVLELLLELERALELLERELVLLLEREELDELLERELELLLERVELPSRELLPPPRVWAPMSTDVSARAIAAKAASDILKTLFIVLRILVSLC